MITAITDGATPLSYQWMFNDGSRWVDITDNGIYSGTTAMTLTINNATTAESGEYRFKAVFPVNKLNSSVTDCQLTLSIALAKELYVDDGPDIVGDCVDCYQCVAVCPTGIDIRDGAQLACIQCGLCIDACDTVMDKIGKPRGLVDYDTDINIQRHLEGKQSIYRFIRPRTIIYMAMILLVCGLMLFSLINRRLVDLNVLHDRNPLYVQLSDGAIRNGYTLRLINKATTARDFELSLAGAPEGFSMQVVGIQSDDPRSFIVPIDQDITKELRVQVFAPPKAELGKSQPIGFSVRDVQTGEAQQVNDYFKAP